MRCDGLCDGLDAKAWAWLSLVGLKAVRDLIVGKWKDVTKRASC